jgi:hypothetical protein
VYSQWQYNFSFGNNIPEELVAVVEWNAVTQIDCNKYIALLYNKILD